MSELHTQRDHGDESRVIPRENPDPLPSQGSASPVAVPSSSTARQHAERDVRRGLERLTGADRELIPLVEQLVTMLHRECAARRVELRQSEREVRRLQALVYSLDGDPHA